MPLQIFQNWGTETAFTLNADGLASAAARQGAVVDNSTTKYDDFLINAMVKTITGTLGTGPAVRLWVYAVTYNGNYTDAATGADAAFTMPTSPCMRPIDLIPISTALTATYNEPKNLSSLFPGGLPAKWGIVVENQTGLALSGTAGQAVVNVFSYTPIYYTF